MASSSSSPAARKPHFLMMPYPLPSHISPLLHLSKLLVARGFGITLVTSEFNVRNMQSSTQELNKRGIKLVGIADGLPETHERECMLESQDFLGSLIFMHTSFDELVGKMVQEEGLTITCIISDSFLPWTQDVANKWQIPRVSYWPYSLAAFACSISLPKIMEASPNLDPFKADVYENGPGELLYCIPGISQIDKRMLPFHTLDGQRSAEWMRQQVQSQMERVNEVLCILCNSFPDLEKEVHTQLKELLPSSIPMFTLGPLFLTASMGSQDDNEIAGDEDEECIQWLDKQEPRSVIYISLGTVAVLEEREIQEIALGLAASRQPFLWVLRLAPCETALRWFSEEGRGRGKVTRWAPQIRVLSHKAVGGFLTHCGWNSTLESMSKGVPVIAWPQMIDQMTNSWYMVEKEEVGVRLQLEEGGRVGRAGVEKAIRTLMQEEHGHRLRARACRLPTLAQSALAISLPTHLDSFIECILSSPTRVAMSCFHSPPKGLDCTPMSAPRCACPPARPNKKQTK